MDGFLKLYNKMLDWEWYDDINTKVVFLHCLLRANWKAGSWHGIKYEPGQFITSLPNLATETHLTVRQVRTALEHLKSTGEVTDFRQANCRVITVNNWNQYQGYDRPNDRPATDQRQTCDRPATADKDYIDIKTIKTNNKRFVKPTVDEIRNYCLERHNGIDAQQFFDYYESKGWMIGKNHMKDWKASVRTWENRRKGEVNGSVGTVPRDDEEQRNRELDEYIRRQKAGEFDNEDAELRAILG